MGFFDFIGDQPNQLSLAEVLSAVPAIAGPILTARGRKVGLPLGIGLTAIGGLGQELAQRRQQQAQHQGLAKLISGMPGVTPEQQKFLGQYVEMGGDPSSIVGSIFKNQFSKSELKPFPISNGKEERMFDPNKEADIPSGWYSSSFKPGATKTPLKTIYGPKGETQEVGIEAGYTPPAGWSLKAPDKPITINNYERPLGQMQYDASGKPLGVPEVSKTGEIKWVPAPANMPARPAHPAKPLTPAEINAISKQINDEWALQPPDVSASGLAGKLTGKRQAEFVAKRRREIYASRGYDENGQPFKPGQVVGKTATGEPIVWNP